MTKQLTKQEVEAVVERIGGVKEIFACRVKNGVSKPFKVIGTVYIGTVLEKMDKSDCFVKSIWGKIKGYGSGLYYNDLVLLWRPLGLSSSLQEIILESGYTVQCIYDKCPHKDDPLAERFCIYEEVLKSPEANALFSFLQEIL